MNSAPYNDIFAFQMMRVAKPLFLSSFFLFVLSVAIGCKDAISTNGKEERMLTGESLKDLIRFRIHPDERMSPVEKDTLKSTSMPESLVVDPGVYSFENKFFDFREEGLYSWCGLNNQTHSKIVFKTDFKRFIESIAQLHAHGTLDNRLNLNQLEKKAQSTALSLTCTPISKFTANLLNTNGHRARMVLGMAIPALWNKVDNGHTLLEVINPESGKWFLVDMDEEFLFLDSNNKALSFIELSKTSWANVTLLSFAKQAKRKPIDSEFYCKELDSLENFKEDQAALIQWYQRVLKIVFIHDENNICFFDENYKKELSDYSPRTLYIDSISFIKKFYN